MTQDRIDLSGLKLLPPVANDEGLSGTFATADLARLFTESWVPPMECQHCGRSDYCKFTEPHPYPAPRSVGRLKEIRCGVVTTMITNYVEGVFPLLLGFSPDELQRFLDGSYHLVKFAYRAEQQIGAMISKDIVDWYGKPDYKAFFFGMTAQLRRHLDNFAAQLQEIEAFRTKSTVILTEGPSEMMFLRKLNESRLAAYMNLDVRSYYGKGNRRRGKLERLAKYLREQGYQLFIQADLDGAPNSVLNDLIDKEIVKKENTFEFEVDFETAFPANVLLEALNELGMLLDVSLDDFEAVLSTRVPGKPVLPLIKKSYLCIVDKIELAEALAEVLNSPFDYPHDSPFWTTQAGKFMNAVGGLP